MMLGALAQATSRLRLGTMVTGVHYRHPAVLANMISTLDIISNGRLEVGIGAGWNEEESGAYGIELGGARARSDRFEEACEILVGMLSQESTSFDGQYYRVTEARNEPKGPQRPHPPICIGGGGEKRTLRTVARFAQHWNSVDGDEAVFARKVEVLAGHCRDIGRDPAEILLSSQLRYDPANPAQMVDSIGRLAEAGLQLAIVYLPPPHSPSVLEPLADALATLG